MSEAVVVLGVLLVPSGSALSGTRDVVLGTELQETLLVCGGFSVCNSSAAPLLGMVLLIGAFPISSLIVPTCGCCLVAGCAVVSGCPQVLELPPSAFVLPGGCTAVGTVRTVLAPPARILAMAVPLVSRVKCG